MSVIPTELIKEYRARTYRLLPELRLKIREEAIEFVKERGFVYFWPISGIDLPSLWTATAGNRPVADKHDDPGHVTWGWKDSLLGGQAWYYAKVLRKKATMIDMGVVPYFYALSQNFDSPEEDYLTQYEQGKLSREARQVYETLLSEGALDSIALRRAARLSSAENETRFDRALAYLQSDFKISPIAVSSAGGWRYAFVYDITVRHYPEISEQARLISENQARLKLTTLYFLSIGIMQPHQLTQLFNWSVKMVDQVLIDLEQRGFIRQGLTLENQPGKWIALAEVFDE